jgi:hypothetical protein
VTARDSGPRPTDGTMRLEDLLRARRIYCLAI